MTKSWDYQRIVAETGSTRTILPTDHTTLFTNRGGGACTGHSQQWLMFRRVGGLSSTS